MMDTMSLLPSPAYSGRCRARYGRDIITGQINHRSHTIGRATVPCTKSGQIPLAYISSNPNHRRASATTALSGTLHCVTACLNATILPRQWACSASIFVFLTYDRSCQHSPSQEGAPQSWKLP